MLLVIAISFKAHKIKEQEINRRGNTLFTLTECHYKKKKTKKQKNKNKNYYKRNYKKILSAKTWPLEEKGLLSVSAEREECPWPSDQLL